ncbi:MAG: uracil-DNA glycosylase [Desulfuromonadales bacterium]
MPGDALIDCRRCRRLCAYMAGLPPRRGLSRSDYWNRPAPGFGDPQARICLLGLAPGAHGANRTGRPFTGDGAGDFMYPLLYRAGLASQAEATHIGDGLQLHDLYITNAVKCVPPGNKPEPSEFSACRPWLAAELANMPRLRVIVALGQGAFLSMLRLLKDAGKIGRLADFPFAHQTAYSIPGGPVLVASYHTSRYNIQTGRLTEAMFDSLLAQVLRLAAED